MRLTLECYGTAAFREALVVLAGQPGFGAVDEVLVHLTIPELRSDDFTSPPPTPPTPPPPASGPDSEHEQRARSPYPCQLCGKPYGTSSGRSAHEKKCRREWEEAVVYLNQSQVECSSDAQRLIGPPTPPVSERAAIWVDSGLSRTPVNEQALRVAAGEAIFPSSEIQK